jgi:hypothetical protein
MNSTASSESGATSRRNAEHRLIAGQALELEFEIGERELRRRIRVDEAEAVAQMNVQRAVLVALARQNIGQLHEIGSVGDLVQARRQTLEDLNELAGLNENESRRAVEKAQIDERERLEGIGESLAGALGAFGDAADLAVRFRQKRYDLVGFAERPRAQNDSRGGQGSGHRCLQKLLTLLRKSRKFFLNIALFSAFGLTGLPSWLNFHGCKEMGFYYERRKG